MRFSRPHLATAIASAIATALTGVAASSALISLPGPQSPAGTAAEVFPLASEGYCQGAFLEGAATDCLGHFHSLTDNTVTATKSICAGAFTEGGELYGSYLCNNIGANEAEHMYSGEHLLYPVAHNHGTPGNTVFGEESY